VIELCIGINTATFNARSLGPSIIGFLQTVRDGHPGVPVAVCTPIVSPSRETAPNAAGLTLQDIRSIIRSSVRALDDSAITLLEGLDLLGQDEADYLADGLHPTDAGYRLMAERIAPRLRALVRSLNL
jgi:lysophospholipase L1-like esterase